MPIRNEVLYNKAVASLKRMQNFKADSLSQENVLGEALNFKDAVKPAQELIGLYKRLSVSALEDFPDKYLDAILSRARSDYELFTQILEFNPGQRNPKGARDSMIESITDAYPVAFEDLHVYIAYSLHRSADFHRLDAEARATLQGIEYRAGKALESREKEAQRILEEIRNTAAELGVTQQADHFRKESEHHETQARTWRNITMITALVLAGLAFISLYFHKIPGIKPENLYETIQLGISKIFIFTIATYVLILCAKNFLNHKHNSIVNKHRQNALMTHKALIEAAGNSGVREAIMVQAASCIFSPQSTGYTRSSSDGDISAHKPIIELLSKSAGEASPK